MISAYYKESGDQKHFSTRSHSSKGEKSPFTIPFHHSNISDAQIFKLHKQCQKFQTEFSFIKAQIDRQTRLKKEKSLDHSQFDKSKLKKVFSNSKIRKSITEKYDEPEQTGKMQSKMEQINISTNLSTLNSTSHNQFMNLINLNHLEKFDRVKFCIKSEKRKKNEFAKTDINSSFRTAKTQQFASINPYIFPTFGQESISILRKPQKSNPKLSFKNVNRLSQ